MQTEALRNLVAKIKHLQCEMQTVELKAANKGCPTPVSYTHLTLPTKLEV